MEFKVPTTGEMSVTEGISWGLFGVSGREMM